jgi:hypothetical protein
MRKDSKKSRAEIKPTGVSAKEKAIDILNMLTSNMSIRSTTDKKSKKNEDR